MINSAKVFLTISIDGMCHWVIATSTIQLEGEVEDSNRFFNIFRIIKVSNHQNKN